MFKTFFLAGAVALASSAGAASAVTIDFNTLPDSSTVASNTKISDQYASLGVTFELFENGVSVGPARALGDERGNVLLNVTALKEATAANRADVLQLSFSAPVWGLSFVHFDNVAGGFAKAYDANGLLLEEYATAATTLTYKFKSENIARLEISQGGEKTAFGINDLNFVAPVPLPATAPLLIGALGFLGMRARKARKA